MVLISNSDFGSLILVIQIALATMDMTVSVRTRSIGSANSIRKFLNPTLAKAEASSSFTFLSSSM